MTPSEVTKYSLYLDERRYYSQVLASVGVPFVGTSVSGRLFSIRIDHDECHSGCKVFNFNNGVVWSQVMRASDEVTEARLPRGYWDAIPEDWEVDEYISWIMGDHM